MTGIESATPPSGMGLSVEQNEIPIGQGPPSKRPWRTAMIDSASVGKVAGLAIGNPGRHVDERYLAMPQGDHVEGQLRQLTGHNPVEIEPVTAAQEAGQTDKFLATGDVGDSPDRCAPPDRRDRRPAPWSRQKPPVRVRRGRDEPE
jgi:hypothetical protein